MNGVTPLLSLYAFTAWAGKTLSHLKQRIFQCKVSQRSTCAATSILLCLLLNAFIYLFIYINFAQL